MMSKKSSTHIFSIRSLSILSTIFWCISIGWSTALSNIFMVATTLLVLIDSYKNGIKMEWKSIFLFPSSVLFILMTFSMLWSSSFTSALSHLKSYLPFILFPISLINGYKIDNQTIIKGVKYLSYTLVFAYFTTIIWNLLPENFAAQLTNMFGDLLKPYTSSNRQLFGWYVPYMERVHFSNILVYSSLAIFFIYLNEKKINLLIISIFLSTSPFVLGARASMLGWISMLPILIILLIRNFDSSKRNAVLIISIISVSILSYIIYPNIHSRWEQTKYELNSIRKNDLEGKTYEHFTTYTRFIAWQTAYDLFEDKPLLGHGIGDYLDMYDKTYTTNHENLPICYHSQWLYFLGVMGIFGTFIFLISYLYFGFIKKGKISSMYFGMFTFYTAIIWIFDTGLLQKKEMMAFVLFLFFTECLKRSDISST